MAHHKHRGYNEPEENILLLTLLAGIIGFVLLGGFYTVLSWSGMVS